MKVPVSIVIVFLVIILLGGIFLVTKSHAPVEPSTPTAEVRKIPIDGNTYTDTQGVYTFLYPLDYKLDQQNDGKQIRIYKTGATQQGQTEMYDGVVMVFETMDTDGVPLSKWVDGYIKKTTADGTIKLVGSKKQMTQNGYAGFVYHTQGLGEFTNYVFQKSEKSHQVVVITTLVEDPQKVGFQKEVDKILSTLEVHK
jgi:hypothetical protein